MNYINKRIMLHMVSFNRRREKFASYNAIQTCMPYCKAWKQTYSCIILIPYSLKFLRTKISIDFVILKHPRKFYPRNFQPMLHAKRAMSVGILKYFTLKCRSSLPTLTAFCLKYSLLREYFACKQGSIESGR